MAKSYSSSLVPLLRSLFILYFINLALFIAFYSVGLYSFAVFQEPLIALAQLPVASFVRNTLMAGWMLVPLSMCLYPIAHWLLKLSPQKFLYIQLFFLASILITLQALI